MKTLSNLHIDQLAGTAVVPVVCESYKGTAFFIAPELLLTARHIVVDAEPNDDSTYIIVGGKKVFCDVEYFTKEVDVALLHTKDYAQDYDYCLPLLAGDMIQQKLNIIGYPYELGNCIDYFIIKVENWKDCGNISRGFDIFVRRLENNLFQSYRGFSGSPVINHNGQVVGVVTDQFTGTLGYLALKNIENELKTKCADIRLSTNTEEADNRVIGLQTSQVHIEKAILKAHKRYHPSLHQENNEFAATLDMYCFHSEIMPITKFWNKYEDWLIDLNSKGESINQEYVDNCTKILQSKGQLIDPAQLYPIASDPKVSIEIKKPVIELYNELYDLQGEYDFITKDCLCIIGDAGTGKTHLLCKYAAEYCKRSQVYLFFGSDFKNELDAWESILNKLQLTEDELAELNNLLESKHRRGLIIIDGLNEGVGESYWKDQLSILTQKLEPFPYIRLIVSIRSGAESIILDNSNLAEYYLYGYTNHIKAMETYFNEFGLPNSLVGQYSNIGLFKNPLFLYIFCIAYNYMPYEYRNRLTHWQVYRWYLNARNRNIANCIDEDPFCNITFRYLIDVASIMVDKYLCGDCKRSDAKKASDILSPHKGWEKSILNACLKENLLMASYQDDMEIKFGFDNIGDFMKAVSFIRYCKENELSDIQVIEELKKIIDDIITKGINPSYVRNFITAFLSLWHPKEKETWTHKELTHGFLTEYLLNSFIYEPSENRFEDFPKTVLSAIFNQDKSTLSISFLLRSYAHLTTDSVIIFHNYLLSLSQNDLDFHWSQQCNDLFNKNKSLSYKEFANYSQERSVSLSHAIITSWMCAASYPIIRYAATRALFITLLHNKDIIRDLMELFKGVRDMYVHQGLFAAIYGVVLISDNSDNTLTGIGEYIFDTYYKIDGLVPNDIIVRQWQLKIFERINYLNNGFWCWENILTRPRFITGNDSFKVDLDLGDISSVFGKPEKGTFLLAQSLCNGGNGGSDFCRYVLHMNNTYDSYTYYQTEQDKVGVSMFDVQYSIINFIHDNIGWNEQISEIDIKNTSSSRFENKKERIGKKYQWLGLYNVEASLMDTCFMKRDYWNHQKGFHTHNFPWYSDHSSTFDPTLSITDKLNEDINTKFNHPHRLLRVENIQEWLDITPKAFYELIDEDGESWIPLYFFDSKSDRIDEGLPSIEEFIHYNGFFIKEDNTDKFIKWARTRNFHGRWMPETSGITDFIWNEYPWSDSFKNGFDEEDLCYIFDQQIQPITRSYMGQLQENYGGIPDDEHRMTTAYMPIPDVMAVLDLHVAERGIVRDKTNNITSIVLQSQSSSYHGLLMRKSALIDYLRLTKQNFVSCMSGEKSTIVGVHRNNVIEFSGAYGMTCAGEFFEIDLFHKSN